MDQSTKPANEHVDRPEKGSSVQLLNYRTNTFISFLLVFNGKLKVGDPSRRWLNSLKMQALMTNKAHLPVFELIDRLSNSVRPLSQQFKATAARASGYNNITNNNNYNYYYYYYHPYSIGLLFIKIAVINDRWSPCRK